MGLLDQRRSRDAPAVPSPLNTSEKIDFQAGQEHEVGKAQDRQNFQHEVLLDQVQPALANDDAGDNFPNYDGYGDGFYS